MTLNLLANQKSPITKLKDPPIKPVHVNYGVRTLQYYQDNGNNYVMIFRWDGFFKYDLDRQIVAKHYETLYYAMCDPDYLTGCFNPIDGIFYLFAVHDLEVTFLRTFDVNKGEWHRLEFLGEGELDDLICHNPTSNLEYIPSPINEAYIIKDNAHYKVLTVQTSQNVENLALELAPNIGKKIEIDESDKDTICVRYRYQPSKLIRFETTNVNVISSGIGKY